MTLFEIVALYVALNLILLCVLMLRVGQVRNDEKIQLGDGGSQALLARIRAHGNFIETAPLAMMGLFALAGLQAAPLALHIFGTAFTFGRVAHAHGMAQKNAMGAGRVVGALLSLLTFLGMAILMLYKIFAG